MADTNYAQYIQGKPNYRIPTPVYRRLQGYAFDPSLSNTLDTAYFNKIIFKIRWKDYVSAGPVGEYFEVIDVDPPSSCFYAPVDLNDPGILAQDGITPSENSPQFHQQMVYAVAMTTIQNFEKALGRWIIWSARDQDDNGKYFDRDHREMCYVGQLRIYPHAFRNANAYYNPGKKAILFGYFSSVADNNGLQLPGGLVFTCLSHDIVAHELTHAILDGINPRLIDPTNSDSLAFHEAFADMIALFQHFTFPEVMKNQIAKTKGDLESQNLLGELAQQFGMATGKYGALRSAIGDYDEKTGKWTPQKPDPAAFAKCIEPHERGAILVATIFDAFLQIYKKRVADLLRIASDGTGIVRAGELHPDLVNRLAAEASKTASHVLGMCIRALDYCPPVDLSFGDYLRAMVTADLDMVPEDELQYRIALIDAFRKRGIFPEGIKTLSEDSLRWLEVKDCFQSESDEMKMGDAVRKICEWLREFQSTAQYFKNRKEAFMATSNFQEKLHGLLNEKLLAQLPGIEMLLGISLNTAVPNLTFTRNTAGDGNTFTVQSVSVNRRIGPAGNHTNHVVMMITQSAMAKDPTKQVPDFKLRGGATLVFDLDSSELVYAITKDIKNPSRMASKKKYLLDLASATMDASFAEAFDTTEIFGHFSHLHFSK